MRRNSRLLAMRPKKSCYCWDCDVAFSGCRVLLYTDWTLAVCVVEELSHCIWLHLCDVLYWRDGMHWAHLSCALWIPEIVIADTDRMEPIANISDIPVWSLTLGPFFIPYQNLPGRCLVCKHGSHVINILKADWSSVKNKQLTAMPC